MPFFEILHVKLFFGVRAIDKKNVRNQFTLNNVHANSSGRQILQYFIFYSCRIENKIKKNFIHVHELNFKSFFNWFTHEHVQFFSICSNKESCGLISLKIKLECETTWTETNIR